MTRPIKRGRPWPPCNVKTVSQSVVFQLATMDARPINKFFARFYVDTPDKPVGKYYTPTALARRFAQAGLPNIAATLAWLLPELRRKGR